jgi:SpoVK/Ycf46/Vps4 family AAA+-type ATPase
MVWEDAVLHPHTADLIDDIRRWVSHQHLISKDIKFSSKIRPGFKVLFYGPPGTGKTLTATLLGKEFGLPVYKIDLSMIVSKYIGETEKNLGKVFDRAKSKNWILFFDEADALFGKRSSVSSSNDRYANQEVSYLLQRIEDFDGLVILASNLKTNIDTAFMRRFNAVVHFPSPNVEERKLLWTNTMPEKTPYHDHVNISQLATKYEFTGAEIVNIVRFAYLKTLALKLDKIPLEILMEGIKKELQKEGKYISSKND